MAQQLGANPDTVKNWEMGYTAPALWFIPRIIRFLGYVPFDTTRDSFPLGTRLKEYRRVYGLSQKRLATRLGVDPSTILHWEQGRSRPNDKHTDRIEALLKLGRQAQCARTA